MADYHERNKSIKAKISTYLGRVIPGSEEVTETLEVLMDRIESEALARREVTLTELLRHRQSHRTEDGASTCICGEWEGPYTMVGPNDPRSYAQHLVDHIEAALAVRIS